MGDNLFQVEIKDSGAKRYQMQIYYKISENRGREKALEQLTLEEGKLPRLTKENFSELTGYHLPLADSVALREVISDIIQIRFTVEDIILIEFDYSNSMICSNNLISITFNFTTINKVKMDKEVDWTQIECKAEWAELIGYDANVLTASQYAGTSTKREYQILSFISLLINLWTYYIVLVMIVDYGKFKYLSQQARIKVKWLKMRKNMRELNIDYPEIEFSAEPPFSVLSVSTILLTISNTFQFFVIVVHFMEAAELTRNEYKVDDVDDTLLGIGTACAWLNVLSLLSRLEQFQVVAPRHAGHQVCSCLRPVLLKVLPGHGPTLPRLPLLWPRPAPPRCPLRHCAPIPRHTRLHPRRRRNTRVLPQCRHQRRPRYYLCNGLLYSLPGVHPQYLHLHRHRGHEEGS